MSTGGIIAAIILGFVAVYVIVVVAKSTTPKPKEITWKELEAQMREERRKERRS